MGSGAKRIFFGNRIGAHAVGNTYPVLRGDDIPNGLYIGPAGQHYVRSTGDVWINANGHYRWLKVVEV